jgi:predicted membrane-bound mannosyltransferase
MAGLPAIGPQGSERLATGRLARMVEALLVLALLTAALGARLPNLALVDGTSFKADEGIHGEALLLMRAGYRPLDEIFESQGPLYLQVHYPLFELFGGTFWAARFSVALCSLVGWRSARRVAGAVARRAQSGLPDGLPS